MLPLERLKDAFASGIIEHDTAVIAAALRPSALGASRELSIYRNHFLITLEDALATTFPAIRSLVGAGYFSYAACRFAQANPPSGPCLFEYGDGFAEFVEQLPEAWDLPYLGDVARVEWAVNVSYHAPNAAPLTADRMGKIGPELYGRVAFIPNPAFQLVASCFPITAIWKAAQPDSDPAERVDLDQGGESVLVLRAGDEVVFRRLPDNEYRFLSALREGRSLFHAMAVSRESGASFDAGAALEALVEAGAFIGLVIPSRR